MNEDLKEFVSLIAWANRIALFTGAGISPIRHPRLSQSRRHLDQAGTDRFLRLHALRERATRDLAPAFRHGANSSTGSAEPRSSGGGGIGSVRQG